MDEYQHEQGMRELTAEEIQSVSGAAAFGDFWCGPDGCYANGWWTEFWAY